MKNKKETPEKIEEPQVYKVMVDDNFDFMDEDERVCAGQFYTYEEALEKAKAIVLRSLANSIGTTAEEIYDHYTSFGADAFIIPQPWQEKPKNGFSSWKFAKVEAVRIAKERELLEQKTVMDVARRFLGPAIEVNYMVDNAEAPPEFGQKDKDLKCWRVYYSLKYIEQMMCGGNTPYLLIEKNTKRILKIGVERGE